MIRKITPSDITQICEIYNFYVENTIISFEEEPVPQGEMERRIVEITAGLPYYVHIENEVVLGYVYASEWKRRSAYRFTVESTIYVRNAEHGKGIGRQLYSVLLDDLKNRKIHSVIGGIALPNEGSQILHEKLGFTKVAHFNDVGYKFNKWIDVGYWQLIFD